MPAAHPANRLAGETSPYLLQHAHNPVDWYPWGEEAFAAARERGVPIFLSVGYSTCYWCHVMERECFENAEIAEQMNRQFVCVKVDREQMPDVDDVYMTAVQLLTGRGGWPMSVFLTPPGARGEGDAGLEAFWGGTYFPPEPRPGLPSFPQVMDAMSNAYANKQSEVLEQAASISGAVRAHLSRERTPVRLTEEPARRAFEALWTGFDQTNGGFHGAPKFPQPVFLEFLLDAHERYEGEDRERAETMLRLTLDRMATGGMNDQVGGGFHRYSVDATWTVPHFERMLYDQGQLEGVYARASVRFDDAFYARTARRTCEYVLREMRHESGGLFSAQDAEVNAREGLNYLWTLDELGGALSEDDAAFAASVYAVDAGPNFQDPHHTSEPARNVLKLAGMPTALADRAGESVDAWWERVERINTALYDVRARREQPGLDDKVLAGWNGLMIAGLAETGAAMDEGRFTDAAAAAARFVLAEMRTDEGDLLRVWRDGTAGTPAVFEDYALLIHGLLALHRATDDEVWRDEAVALSRRAGDLFGAEGGGWYDAPDGRDDLIVRLVSVNDGAVPSATSVMLNNLLALRAQGFEDTLGASLAATSSAIVENPLTTINSARVIFELDGAFLERFGMGASAPEAPALIDASPVEIFASAAELEVGDDGAEISLELRIAEGYHVTAHDAGVEGMVGLDVAIDGGMGFGVVVDYPTGRVLEGPFVPKGETLFAHEGAVRIDVRVERTGEPVTGTPRLVVTYQACDERACMEPMSAVLGVEIRLAEE